MLESCFLIRLGRLLKEARATLGVLLTDLSATSRSDPPGTGSYYGKLGPACVCFYYHVLSLTPSDTSDYSPTFEPCQKILDQRVPAAQR